MYVITNGNTYVTKSKSGKVGKTNNILEAEWFDSIDIANIVFQHAPSKTKGYYIKDLETCYVYKRYTNGKIKFPREVRERVTEIFMYQTSENTKHKIMWSITRRLLSLCIKL